MMQTVLSSVLLDVPRAAVIWLTLLAVTVTTVTWLIARSSRSETGDRIRQAVLPTELDMAREEREQQRYAAEIAVAAERAATTARRRRGEWLAAQDEVESAWQAYEDAEAELRRLAAATAMPLPRTPRTPAEYADRERYLHRAALDSYGRGELSVDQLGDVFAHRGCWDPRRHPVEQELVLRRAARDTLLARHQAAVQREREAWRIAESTATAARSLRDEAFAAAYRRPERPDLLPLGEQEPQATTPVRPVRPGRPAVAS